MGIGGSVVGAITSVFNDALGYLLGALLKLSLIPLLQLKDPTNSAPALQAWETSFEIAVGILPVIIAFGVISRITAEQGEGSFWELGFRVATAVAIIAVSKPMIGMGVDFTNAIVMQLAPSDVNFQIVADGQDAWAKLAGAGVKALLGSVMGALMVIGVLIASILLIFRQFLIFTVFIAAPILAVFWIVDWGFMETVQEFSNKISRMGMYTLLSGILIAIGLRVFNVILSGGLTTGNTTDVGEVMLSTAAVAIVPLMIVAITWKSVEWAGQPMGVGQAMSGAITAAAVTAGGVAGTVAGAGAGAGAKAGQAAGSNVAGSASGGGGSGVASAGESGESIPESADSQSAVGEQVMEQQSGLSDRVRQRAKSAVSTDHSPIKSLGEGAREDAAKAQSKIDSELRPKAADAHAEFSQKLSAVRGSPDDLATVDPDRINTDGDSVDSGYDIRGEQIDLTKAHEAGLIDEEPAEAEDYAEVKPDGSVRYHRDDGQFTSDQVQEDMDAAATDYLEPENELDGMITDRNTDQWKAKWADRTREAGGRARQVGGRAARAQAGAAKIGAQAAVAGVAPRAAFAGASAYRAQSGDTIKPNDQEGIPENASSEAEIDTEDAQDEGFIRDYRMETVEHASISQSDKWREYLTDADQSVATQGRYVSAEETDSMPEAAQNYGYLESEDGSRVPLLDFQSAHTDLEDGDQVSIVGGNVQTYPTDRQTAHPAAEQWADEGGDYIQLDASGADLRRGTDIEAFHNELAGEQDTPDVEGDWSQMSENERKYMRKRTSDTYLQDQDLPGELKGVKSDPEEHWDELLGTDESS